jgi:RimJ/RimL family protein N-acetyltransferase
MQWLIGPEQNELLQSYFKGIFPPLQHDEALLEGAFTPEEFRGRRIMPAAMAQIAGRAAEIGAQRVLTFVTHDNVPSLKGCRRSGFAPCLTRNDRWRHFHHHISFSALPAGTLLPFEQ